jgi:hypothetical protein
VAAVAEAGSLGVHSRIVQPLPKGVTGFDAPDDGVPIKRFRAACHAAARQVAGRVQQVRPADEQVTPSFHEALMTLRDKLETVRVLCNAHYPIVAFTTAATHEGDLRLEFMDCPELAEALRTEFSIITRQEACADITDEVVALLGDAELQQMRYWRPQRIGDVIFNYWD